MQFSLACKTLTCREKIHNNRSPDHWRGDHHLDDHTRKKGRRNSSKRAAKTGKWKSASGAQSADEGCGIEITCTD